MRYCPFLIAVSVVAIVSLAPARVTGQAPAPQPKKTTAAGTTKAKTPPRTPWGKPDVSGVWDFRTLTPMERPDGIAGAVFTEQEAKDFERRQSQYNDLDNRSLKDGIDVGSHNTIFVDYGERVSEGRRSSLVVDPPDGKIPPFTPEAEAKRKALAEAFRGVAPDEPLPGGWIEDMGTGSLRVRCILPFNAGPPITPHAYNNLVQLFQTPDHVVIFTEMIHTARIIPLDGRPHGTIRQWAGDSRGRWEGNTLVVDTINFQAPTYMTYGGQFSATMHLIERFTRVDADTLLYEFTVEDPTTWTRPWTVQLPMKKTQDRIYEYACHEGNKAIEIILAGARAKEKAAAEAGNELK